MRTTNHIFEIIMPAEKDLFALVHWKKDGKHSIVKISSVLSQNGEFQPMRAKLGSKVHDGILIAKGTKLECQAIESDGIMNFICSKIQTMASCIQEKDLRIE